jgi:cyanophycinase
MRSHLAGYASAVPSSLSLVSRGPLVVIGGAEDKLGRLRVLSRFVELAGGHDARLAVCATASSLGEEAAFLYEDVFLGLGARSVISASPKTRVAANDPRWLERLDDVTGLFFTGGNQLILSQVAAGTEFGGAVRAFHQSGRVIGGTSAGASVMSEHMVAFGTGGATPKNRIAQMSRGLGLLPELVIDQHFDQRNRYGRLLSLIAQSPSLLGLGIDEDTAAVISDGQLLEVIGRGSVFIVDGANVVTNAATASRTQPLLVSGAVLHVLPSENRFDLGERQLVEPKPAVHPGEVADLAATVSDARQRARRRIDRRSD